jgi:peptidoglycan/xylan/chitin deacetylase (PgdA/CDA1 family)
MPETLTPHPLPPPAAWRPTPLVLLVLAAHAIAVAGVIVQPTLWPWALGVVVISHALITAASLWPRGHWLGANLTRLPAAAAARGEVAITIDDGPDPAVTPVVLDLLDAHGVQATFFCIGSLAAAHPELCRDIVRRGHAVENHSARHRHNFSLLGPRGYARELQAGQAALAAVTGRSPQFFRAPAGFRNPFLWPELARLNLRLASWTRRGFDTRERDPAVVLRRLLRGLRAGDILLLHDGHAARTTSGQPVILAVLPQLLGAIRHAGLLPVTLHAACATSTSTPSTTMPWAPRA